MTGTNLQALIQEHLEGGNYYEAHQASIDMVDVV